MLGTDWTAPGEGDDLATILQALGGCVKVGDETRRTNIRLTGEPIQEYDRQRIRNIEVTLPSRRG